MRVYALRLSGRDFGVWAMVWGVDAASSMCRVSTFALSREDFRRYEGIAICTLNTNPTPYTLEIEGPWTSSPHRTIIHPLRALQQPMGGCEAALESSFFGPRPLQERRPGWPKRPVTKTLGFRVYLDPNKPAFLGLVSRIPLL